MDSYNSPRYSADHVIIGAGPAGLQLAYQLEKAGVDYLILEATNGVSASFRKFPRHRKLISVNKRFTDSDDNMERRLRWDWNCLMSDDEKFHFRNYSDDYFPHADTLVRYHEDFAKHFKLKIRYCAKVGKVRKENGMFRVTDTGGREIVAKNVIVACGLQAAVPDIPGAKEHAVNYDKMSIDPEDYNGKRVLIMGKKNSAFETADNIIQSAALIHMVSPSPIDFAWRSHYIGDVRGLNVGFLDTYMLKIQNASLDAKVTKIDKCPKTGKLLVDFAYGHAFGETQTAQYDVVLTCTGFNFDFSPYKGNCEMKPADGGKFVGNKKNKFPDIDYDFESKNVDGLFTAGILTHKLDYKKKQSGFIHGFRYNAVCLSKILLERYHGMTYPTKVILQGDDTREMAMAKAILREVNNSSGLWQQSGFFCCAVVPSKDDKTVGLLYPDMPLGYAHKRFKDEPLYYTCMLNFGQERLDRVGNVFNFTRVHPADFENAHLSTGIHPIVGAGSYGEEIAITHIIEDLESWWVIPERHDEPMAKFIAISNVDVYRQMAEKSPRKHTTAGLLLEDLPYEKFCMTEETFQKDEAMKMHRVPDVRDMMSRPPAMSMNKVNADKKPKAKL